MSQCEHCKGELTISAYDKGVCPHCQSLLGPANISKPSSDLDKVFDAIVEDDSVITTDNPSATSTASSTTKTSIPPEMANVWHKATQDGVEAGTTIRSTEQDPVAHTQMYVQTRKVANASDGHVSGEFTDFDLLAKIGSGGMGSVYESRQNSIDRTVAIKMVKTKLANNPVVRSKFLIEAGLTAHLDHPNIVPVHELAETEDRKLFYVMKRVNGTPWNKVMNTYSLRKNIEILQRVSDAVAFAHSRGVIHRDIKPSNVMLGKFGEVLLMDWGMAVSVRADGRAERLNKRNSFGGTPSYMSPEMAKGDVAKISERSDIYLLGAILYEIATGSPPHPGTNAFATLEAAAANVIVPTKKAGNLVKIAMRAMSRKPESRHTSVLEFQNDVQDCLDRAESLAAMKRAAKNYSHAKKMRNYELFIKATYGFEEALNMWSGNEMARRGIDVSRNEHASCAISKGDLDLAQSILKTISKPDPELLYSIAVKRRQRFFIKMLKAVIVLLIAVVFLATGIKLVAISGDREYISAQLTKTQEELNVLKQKDDPNESSQLFSAARDAVNAGAFKAAITLATKSLDCVADAPDPKPYQPNRMMLAQLLLLDKQYSSAAAMLCEYMKVKPNDDYARRLLTIADKAPSVDPATTARQLAEILDKQNETVMSQRANKFATSQPLKIEPIQDK